jgi:photosystem II stability/assembly factor-like uncharacterized protein
MLFGGGASGAPLFAGTGAGDVYMLPDGGIRWQRIGSPSSGGAIFAVAAPAASHGLVLAGSFSGIYRGTFDGSTWRWRLVARTGDSAVTAITWSPWNPHQVFASVFGTSPPVLASNDDGRSWHPYAAGLPSTLPTEALLPMPSDSGVMLTTMGGGVWLTHATGRWRDVSAGLPERHAMASTGDPAAGTQFAGTMGYGVYGSQVPNTWRRLGRGLSGTEYTVLSMALTNGPDPQLLAGTARGLFRFVLSGHQPSG